MRVERQSRVDLSWILVLLLAVFAVAPRTFPGCFEAHTGFLPVFNAENLSEAPNWGRVAAPVRGEGKLPYLLAWPILQVAGSGVVAIKWGYGLAFLLGALGTYAWTRHWLGTRGAVLAAVVYTYLPWHLSTVYVRGAYAEAWLWAFWPILFWAADRWVERRTLAAGLAGLPALALALWTQPGLALLGILLLVAYAFAMDVGQRRAALRLAAAFAATLLLLWVAARLLPEGQLPFVDQGLHPFQLLSAAWGNGLSFQLGVAAVGLSIVAVALLVSKGSRTPGDGAAGPARPSSASLGRALWFWVAALCVLILLTLVQFSFLWNSTRFNIFTTYPWQLLALAGLPLAFLAGSVVRLDERLATLPAWAGLVTLVILASYPYLAPSFTQLDPGPEPVAMFQPVEAETPQIIILDYELLPPTEITPTVTLTLTWQAVGPVAGDYTVFAHVLSPDGSKAAQRDTRPCGGECPTDTWQPGEIIVDRYELELSADSPPGPYRIALGLYLLETLDRATVIGRDDRTVFIDVR